MLDHITLKDSPDPTQLPFSHAVRAGDFLFVSGQVSKDVLWDGEQAAGLEAREPIAQQTKIVMDHLQAVLEKAGAGFDRVVMTRIFLRDFRDYDAVNEIYTSYLTSGRLPCRTTVGAIGLADQCDVEIDLIVYCGEDIPNVTNR